jgi:hypothetical protein
MPFVNERRMTMKALYICVALLVATPASAGELKIPDAMLGDWCAVDGEKWLVRQSDMPPNEHGHPSECGVDARLSIGRKDYGAHEVYCKIRSITRHGNALQVRARCNITGEWSNNALRWQLIKNGTRLKSEIIKSTQKP